MSESKDYAYLIKMIAIRNNTTAEEVRQELEGLILVFIEHEDADVRAVALSHWPTASRIEGKTL